MRIVQTFWSCRKNLIENSFGWLSPQYHIMAWALSCLKLKENYSDLHLYTDSNGYDILINYLKLPYKSANVCYDDINDYHENLWAMPKILTYAAQDEPFIHVDGDVFIWERFNTELENANLIAQNVEIGTEYYKGLMLGVKKNIKTLPNFLKKELNKRSIGSYNAGVLGGSDLPFFRKYTDLARNLVDANYKNKSDLTPSVNFNILFEQILFYALSNQEGKKIETIFKESFNDNGYKTNQFADFSSAYLKLKYLHIIGAKKRQQKICDLLGRTLLKEYPEYFFKIVSLFQNDHIHFEKKIKLNLFEPHNSELKCDCFNHTHQFHNDIKESIIQKDVNRPFIKEIELYMNKLTIIKERSSKLSFKELINLEIGINDYYGFFLMTKEQQLDITFKRNPYLEMIDSFDWPESAKKIIDSNLVSNSNETYALALIPQLFFKGLNQLVVDELEYNILIILEEPTRLEDIVTLVKCCFDGTDSGERDNTVYDLILLKLQKLFFNKYIHIQTI